MKKGEKLLNMGLGNNFVAITPMLGQKSNKTEPQCPCQQHGDVLHRAWVRRPPECHNEASPAALPGVGTALGEECAFTKKQITEAFIHGHNG